MDSVQLLKIKLKSSNENDTLQRFLTNFIFTRKSLGMKGKSRTSHVKVLKFMNQKLNQNKELKFNGQESLP